MNRRTFIALGLAGGLALAASAASAKDAGLEGTWTGVTQKGGEIVVTVSGGRASYQFRGASVTVNSASISGTTLTMGVGALNGQVRVKKTGADTAAYSYSDSNGGSASATLKRR
jgi:uncharacterized protein (DUF2141 family)